MQKQHIKLLNSVIEKNNTIPILTSVFIDNGVLTATDLDIKIKIKTDLYKDIKSCVKFETIKGVFDCKKSGIKTNDIEIIVSKDDALIRKGTNKNNVSKIADIYSVDDYPLMQFVDTINDKIKDKVVLIKGIDVNIKDLQDAMDKIYHAISKDDPRYYLRGINFKAVKGNNFIELVATDGRRMFLKQIATKETIENDFSFILPRKTIDVLLELDCDGYINIDMKGQYNLKNYPTKNDIHFTPSQVKFIINEIDIQTKVIDGTYPDYTRVIPQRESFQTLTIKNIKNFKSDLKEFLKLSENKTILAKFLIVNDYLNILEQDTDKPVSTTYDNINFSDDSICIGLNVKYVIEMLENLGLDTVTIMYYDATTPIKIVNNNDIYVLMYDRI